VAFVSSICVVVYDLVSTTVKALPPIFARYFGSISTTTFKGPLLGNHVELMMLAISIFA